MFDVCSGTVWFVKFVSCTHTSIPDVLDKVLTCAAICAIITPLPVAWVHISFKGTILNDHIICNITVYPIYLKFKTCSIIAVKLGIGYVQKCLGSRDLH